MGWEVYWKRPEDRACGLNSRLQILQIRERRNFHSACNRLIRLKA